MKQSYMHFLYVATVAAPRSHKSHIYMRRSDHSLLTFQNFFLLSPCPVLCSASDHWRLMVSHCERVISVYSTFSYNIVRALCGVLFITGVRTVVPVLRHAGVTKGASLILFPFRSVRNKQIRTYTKFI